MKGTIVRFPGRKNLPRAPRRQRHRSADRTSAIPSAILEVLEELATLRPLALVVVARFCNDVLRDPKTRKGGS